MSDRHTAVDKRQTSQKIVVDGSTTYVAEAKPGAHENWQVWRVKKITTSGGQTTITWAGGSARFDKAATDLQGLDYW